MAQPIGAAVPGWQEEKSGNDRVYWGLVSGGRPTNELMKNMMWPSGFITARSASGEGL